MHATHSRPQRPHSFSAPRFLVLTKRSTASGAWGLECTRATPDRPWEIRAVMGCHLFFQDSSSYVIWRGMMLLLIVGSLNWSNVWFDFIRLSIPVDLSDGWKRALTLKMDDTELTYKFWRIRKTVMQVRLIENILKNVSSWQLTASVRIFPTCEYLEAGKLFPSNHVYNLLAQP